MNDMEKRILAIVVVVYFIMCVLTLLALIIDCLIHGKDWRNDGR